MVSLKSYGNLRDIDFCFNREEKNMPPQYMLLLRTRACRRHLKKKSPKTILFDLKITQKKMRWKNSLDFRIIVQSYCPMIWLIWIYSIIKYESNIQNFLWNLLNEIPSEMVSLWQVCHINFMGPVVKKKDSLMELDGFLVKVISTQWNLWHQKSSQFTYF